MTLTVDAETWTPQEPADSFRFARPRPHRLSAIPLLTQGPSCCVNCVSAVA